MSKVSKLSLDDTDPFIIASESRIARRSVKPSSFDSHFICFEENHAPITHLHPKGKSTIRGDRRHKNKSLG